MCAGVGLMGLLGAAKRLMLSSAIRPPDAEPLTPFMGVVVPFGLAAGAMVAQTADSSEYEGFEGVVLLSGEDDQL